MHGEKGGVTAPAAIDGGCVASDLQQARGAQRRSGAPAAVHAGAPGTGAGDDAVGGAEAAREPGPAGTSADVIVRAEAFAEDGDAGERDRPGQPPGETG